MMHAKSHHGSGLRRWTLAWLFLALSALTAHATGGGGGNTGGSGSPDGSTNASTPGDEVTSLPVRSDSAGLTFVGSVRELRALQLTLTGTGRVIVERLDRAQVAVTLMGDYVVGLDRAALSRSSVGILFRGGAPFQGGMARLEIGSSGPIFLSPERVPLPLARLAASVRAQGDLVTLDVFGLRNERAHVGANFATDRVTLVQRMN